MNNSTLLFGENTLLKKMKQDKMGYTPFVSMTQPWAPGDHQTPYKSPVEHYPQDGDHRETKRMSRRQKNEEREKCVR